MSDEPTKRPGRPEKPEGEVRVTLNCRVMPSTKAEIERQAKAAGLSVGKLLDQRFPAPVEG